MQEQSNLAAPLTLYATYTFMAYFMTSIGSCQELAKNKFAYKNLRNVTWLPVILNNREVKGWQTATHPRVADLRSILSGLRLYVCAKWQELWMTKK